MKRIPLTQGYEAIVDDEDYERVSQYHWSVLIAPHSRMIYAHRGQYISPGKKKEIRLHRFIMNVTDSRIYVDHINHNALDCRKENMRLSKAHENSRNKRKTRSNTHSKFKGVTQQKGRWRSVIWLNDGSKKNLHLGYFDNEVDAARAYNEAAIKYFGEFACLNKL